MRSIIAFSEKRMAKNVSKLCIVTNIAQIKKELVNLLDFYFLKRSYFCIYSFVHEYEIKLILDRYVKASSSIRISNNGHKYRTCIE